MPVTTAFHSVTDYGAVAGNIQDCTGAVNSAIAAASLLGGVVYFPAGVYKITGSIGVGSDSVYFAGAGRRSSIIQFAPTTNPATLFLFEGSGSLRMCGISDLTIAAGSDTTTRKIAIDIHDARHFFCQNVEVRTWSGDSSVGLKLRGRDSGLFHHLRLEADYPLVIGQNDRDSTKDLDHHWFVDCELGANNPLKIAVLIESATVLRNTLFAGQAWVQGGLNWVDLTAPRRRSNNVRIVDVRVEGLAETAGDPATAYAIDIQKHTNGKLRSLKVENVLLAEGSDARYDGVSLAAAWNGLRATGVERLRLDTVAYGGRNVPLVYDGELIATGCQFTPEDNNKAIPEHESHWDRLGIQRPRSWWNMRNASGATDEQDSALGNPDIDLQAAGTVLPTQQVLVDGWHGYWVQFTGDTNQKLRLNNADASLDPATHSVAAFAIVKFSTTPPAGNVEVLNLGGDTNGPRLRMNSSGALFLTAAGVNGTASATTFVDDQAVGIWFYVNHTASEIAAVVRKEDGTQETITVTYSAGLSNTVNKCIGSFTVTGNAFTGWTRHLSWFLDAAARQVPADVLTAMRWTT